MRDGYIHILTKVGYRPEHRVIMEQKMGRPLVKGESVHHLDGDRANNEPKNLELWIRPSPNGVRALDLICPHCGQRYIDI